MDRKATDAFTKLAVVTLAGAVGIYACFGKDNRNSMSYRNIRTEKQHIKPREVFQLATQLTGELLKNLTDKTYTPCNPASVPLEVKLNAFMSVPISDMTDGNRYKEKQILEDRQYLLEHPLEAEIYWDETQRKIVNRYELK